LKFLPEELVKEAAAVLVDEGFLFRAQQKAPRALISKTKEDFSV